MPVERSRSSRRTGADGTQLVWTQPDVGPGIAFATALTPSTFAEELPVPQAASPKVDGEPTFFLFDLATDAPTTPRRASHKRKARATESPASPSSSSDSPSPPSTGAASPAAGDAPPPHIPRPANAFILFRSSFVRARAVPTAAEPSHAALSAIAGLTWAALPPREKAVWHAKARAAREEHARRFPGYAFRPKRAGGGGGKGKDPGGEPDREPKKPRDLPPADRARAAHIAGLLLAGTRGPALDKAIAEWDAQRATKGIEVRFGRVETPEGGVEQEECAVRKTERAEKRRRVKSESGTSGTAAARRRQAAAVAASSPSSPTPAPFSFDALDLSALDSPVSPLDLGADNSAFPWPSSSPFDFNFDSPLLDFDSVPQSPVLFESAPATPFDSVPASPFVTAASFSFTDSSCPASPALSHASSASSSAWSSRTGSYEDLALAMGPAPTAPPMPMSMEMSACWLDGMQLHGLLPPYDLDLELGLGLDEMGYLTGPAAVQSGAGGW